ncbi:hypothetical protein TUM12370_36730 [Salmonella enterica subsp. enterica serovar Choleraesuis]|nr:hypothetical protein TUM12370_36730 [Salmonella enterica subsp. enterica serovar Choleraesuis]
MSRVSELWLERQERGYDCDKSLYVCTDCFDDDGLQGYITRHGQPHGCSFCQNDGENRSAMRLFDVLEFILASIAMEWGRAEDEGLPYETREGGWQGDVVDTWDLFNDSLSDELECQHEDLIQEIINSLDDRPWCRRDPYMLPADQIYLNGWREFSQFIIHSARFVFYKALEKRNDSLDYDEINPADILDILGHLAVDLELITKTSANVSLFRSRIMAQDITLTRAAELGPPPSEFAMMPNRMSPAGIPMFYGAFDRETTLAETLSGNEPAGNKAICGEFKTTRPLKLLDLTALRTFPSLFDEDRRHLRNKYAFMYAFRRDFIKPIERTDRAHAEYVPTQVVTEYFRHVFTTPEGEQLDGIIYPSSKNGKQAVVLFTDSSRVRDAENRNDQECLLYLENVTELAC